MARILGIGDNTIDMYVDHGVQYPGGNGINVAVMSRRLGAQASYLGCIGNDDLGDIIRDMLKSEKIDTSQMRRIDYPNAWTRIKHNGNDRMFDGSNPTMEGMYNLTARDFDYIAAHDLTHGCLYGKLDNDLADISRAAPILSFDYADEFSSDYLDKTAQHVDIAFLSNPGASEEACEQLCREVATRGPSTVVVTRGDQGSMAYDRNKFYKQGIVSGHIVDTLGAGDGLIAGFLVAHLNGATLSEGLQKGAEDATVVFGYRGGLGYESKIKPDQAGLSKN